MTPPDKGLIVIVDDEFAIAETLQELLEWEGYRVAVAANGREGLARIAEGHPSLVLTDMMMPVMGGLEMVQAMRLEPAHQGVPVIIMSSAPHTAAIKDAEGSDPKVTFLRKPFDIVRLLNLIEQSLRAAPQS
jgi:CheY-like chemotaxis protein